MNASDRNSNDSFGDALALSADGNTALIGAPYKDDPTSDSGASYVFVRSNTTWTQEKKLTISDKTSSDYMGSSVALTPDGNLALIGVPGKNLVPKLHVGAAYLFRRTGTAWSEQGKMFALDPEEDDYLGNSAAISSDGSTAIVGSDFKANVGAAYADQIEPRVVKTPSLQIAKNRLLRATAFCTVLGAACSAAPPPLDVDFARQALLGVEQAKLVAADGRAQDSFGSSVAISGDTAVMGAPGVDSPGMSGVGAAYVFVRSSGGSTWTQQAKLVADDAVGDNLFGDPAVISEDTIVLGSPRFYTNGVYYSGAAYVFGRSSGGVSWTQLAKLTAGDINSGAQFGSALAISGDTLVIGAPSNLGNNVGAAYVFTRQPGGSTWTQQAKLVGSDVKMYEYFGDAVSIDADTVVVGAASQTSGQSKGAAYVFTRQPGGSTWTEQAKLTADNGELYDHLGSAVLVRGDTVLASATNRAFEGTETVGAVYVFTRPSGGSTWTQQTMLLPSNKGRYTGLGWSLSMEGNTALFGTYATSNAYVFTRSSDGSTWTEQAILTDSGNTALISAWAANTGGLYSSGAAHIFQIGVANGEACTLNSQCVISGVCVSGVCGKPDGASCSSDFECQNKLCNLGSCQTGADLDLQIELNPQRIIQQQPVQVNIHVGNFGPSPAALTILSITLPTQPGVVVNQLAGNGWNCQTGNVPISCTLSQVPVGGAADVTLEFVPPLNLAGFPVSVKIDSATFDQNPINNSAQSRIYNRAPCPTSCGMGSTGGTSDGGTGGGTGSGGCQMGGPAALPFQFLFAMLWLPALLRRRVRLYGASFFRRARRRMPKMSF